MESKAAKASSGITACMLLLVFQETLPHLKPHQLIFGVLPLSSAFLPQGSLCGLHPILLGG